MNKFTRKIIAALLCVLTVYALLGCAFITYAGQYKSESIKSNIDDIITYKLTSEKQASVQSLIDNVFVKQAGTGAEWFVLSLRQYRYSSLDYTAYAQALEDYMSSSSLANPVEKEKYALVLSSLGRGQECAPDIIEAETGKLGLMSYIYSLHLLNLGYNAKSVTKSAVIASVLERQLDDGGWAVSGKVSDVDVTAMTLQALSQNLSDKNVSKASEKAVELISKMSGENNEYSSYGVTNSESVSQVIIALSAMNIDCCKDSRFVKNGKSLIDVLLSYKKPDSSYSHTHESDSSSYPTVQALLALVSYYRFLNSQGSVYKFSVDTQSAKPVTTTKAPSQTEKPSSGASLGDILEKVDIFGLLKNTEATEKETASPSVKETSSAVTETASCEASSTQPQSVQVQSTTQAASSQITYASTETPTFETAAESLCTQESSLTSVAETQTQTDNTKKKNINIYIISFAAVLITVTAAAVIIKKRKYI